LIAERTTFLSKKNKSIAWNVFDLAVVCTSLMDDISTLIIGDAALENTSMLRLLRLTRLVRVVRIIRVLRFFRDLRIIVAGILGSAKSLFWALILLGLIMFIVAVGILQIIAEHIKLLDEQDTPNPDVQALLDNFGGIFVTMFTLYKSIVGGMDWGDAAAPLIRVNFLLGAFYALYIAFAILCVLNIVTGVFVENAAKITAKDEEHMIMEELETRKQWFEDIKTVFASADIDGDGEMRWEEFEGYIADVRIQTYFKKIGLDVESQCAKGLFELLDFDGDGSVNLDEFASSVQEIHGPAKSIDIVRLRHDTKNLKKDVKLIREDLAQVISVLGGASFEDPDSPASDAARHQPQPSAVPPAADAPQSASWVDVVPGAT